MKFAFELGFGFFLTIALLVFDASSAYVLAWIFSGWGFDWENVFGIICFLHLLIWFLWLQDIIGDFSKFVSSKIWK